MPKYQFNTTPERSKLMSRIRGKGGKSEVLLARELWHLGIRYRRNDKRIMGTPDIAITKHKVAVFIDGEFWHGYDWENKKHAIKSNRDYWIPKIERNRMRDIEVNAQLRQEGWFVLRFWEKDVKQDIGFCIEKIQDAILYQQELRTLLHQMWDEEGELEDLYWEDFDMLQ